MLLESDILNARILIVDDQEVNILLLEQILTDEGYTQVTSTTQPQDVVALYRAHHHDLILLDLQMPGMDGFQIMENLKVEHPGGYLPVLVITAQPGHKLRALQAGARDFISKPFELAEVKTRIRNMLEVRLLYKKLDNYNQDLEAQVQLRTQQLQESEARYRSLTELASDWYWEQDEQGNFSKLSGPALEMLGLPGPVGQESASSSLAGVWNPVEQGILQTLIRARQPFLEVLVSRSNADGTVQKFHVSGEPIFNPSSRFIGYRGVGVEIGRPK